MTDRAPVRLADIDVMHSPIKVSGAAFSPDKQPTRQFAANEDVIIIAVARVGNSFKLIESDRGWLCETPMTLREVYDVTLDQVADLLDRRRKESEAIAHERFGGPPERAAE